VLAQAQGRCHLQNRSKCIIEQAYPPAVLMMVGDAAQFLRACGHNWSWRGWPCRR
jgi:hypothetical protein